MTTRQAILDAIRTRLAGITVANGFATDAGLTLLLGETPRLGSDDPDIAIAIVVGADDPQYQGANLSITLPVELHAIARPDLDQPWVAVETVLADIKRAIELEDRTLDGLVPRRLERGSTQTLERETGEDVVGVSVTYLASYVEGWGAP